MIHSMYNVTLMEEILHPWDVKNIVNNGINYLPINSINSTSVVSPRVGGSRHQRTYRGFVSTHTNYFSKHYMYIYMNPVINQ